MAARRSGAASEQHHARLLRRVHRQPPHRARLVVGGVARHRPPLSLGHASADERRPDARSHPRTSRCDARRPLLCRRGQAPRQSARRTSTDRDDGRSLVPASGDRDVGLAGARRSRCEPNADAGDQHGGLLRMARHSGCRAHLALVVRPATERILHMDGGGLCGSALALSRARAMANPDRICYRCHPVADGHAGLLQRDKSSGCTLAVRAVRRSCLELVGWIEAAHGVGWP